MQERVLGQVGEMGGKVVGMKVMEIKGMVTVEGMLLGIQTTPGMLVAMGIMEIITTMIRIITVVVAAEMETVLITLT